MGKGFIQCPDHQWDDCHFWTIRFWFHLHFWMRVVNNNAGSQTTQRRGLPSLETTRKNWRNPASPREYLSIFRVIFSCNKVIMVNPQRIPNIFGPPNVFSKKFGFSDFLVQKRLKIVGEKWWFRTLGVFQNCGVLLKKLSKCPIVKWDVFFCRFRGSVVFDTPIIFSKDK